MRRALALCRVTVRYYAGAGACRASVLALDAIDLELTCADAVGIAGGPGSGKTTLLLCAAGLLRPTAGSVGWFGRRRATAPPPGRIVYAPALYSPWRLPALARSRALRLILLDDPLRAVDAPGYSHLATWLEEARAGGDAVLISAREPDTLAAVTSRVCLLRSGRLQPLTTSRHPSGGLASVAAAPARVAERPAKILVDRVSGAV